MKRIAAGVAVCLGILLASSAAKAEEKKGPSPHLVAVYQIAPGKHLDFLKWMAAREAIAKEVGAPATMWFAHTDGGSWDYVSITAVPDDARKAELDRKQDAIAKQRGLATGFKASLEFRQYVASHTDTYTTGPMTADDMVKMATEK